MVERILIETGLGKGVTEYGNTGDISMLQVAVNRLHDLFPNARIEVLTDSAENLARFCPAAVPLANRGRALWFANGVLLGRYSDLAPRWFVNLLTRFKRTVRSRCPHLLSSIVTHRLHGRNRPAEAETVKAFTRALQSADLLLICGAGGFYDGCQGWNLDILDLVEAAIQRDVPVVMFGQGFGPISDPFVLKRAAKVLPLVNFITLRGGRGSLAILRSLGVPESKVQTTGDEALELAYELRSEEGGQSLGINLRFAGSASTDDEDIKCIRAVLQDFAGRHGVSLTPLPIAMHAYSRDDLTIRQLLIGFDDQSDGGRTLDTPLKVIKQAALCRVVVTGAYHAAVFALAQGIPVVGLAKSKYFSSKFLGLEDQFGEGCQTVFLDNPALPHRLYSAIERAWQNADKLRVPIQAAARRQIQSSQRSYEWLNRLAGRTNSCSNRRSALTSTCYSDLPHGRD
ncbi:MAG: polysaccharide pyruvyl transferase family protein [Terriglobales bacterium]